MMHHYKCIIYGSEDRQCLLSGIHYPHQDKSLSFGFFSLGQVKVHFITVKISIIRSAHALVEPERPVRFDSGLWDEEEENNCDIWQQTKQEYRSTIGIKTRGFTIWAMMLSLCRDGCRLKSTMSPSIRCLSTTSPSLSSWAIFSRFPYFKNLKEEGIIFAGDPYLHHWQGGEKSSPFNLRIAILDKIGTRMNFRTIPYKFPH